MSEMEKEIKMCCECRWHHNLEDSQGRTVYICANCDSPCYLEETDIIDYCEAWTDENSEEW